MFQVRFKASADKRFRKLQSDIQKRIVAKLEFFIAQQNPLQYAEVLTDPRIGRYRFRVGEYRIIFDLEGTNTIMVVDIGHRSDIYRR